MRTSFAENTELRFREHLRSRAWLRPGAKLAVGVSGGGDSVALLRLVAGVRAELGLVVSVTHFNHLLRGRASAADEAFVAALAEKLGFPLHLGHSDVAGQAQRDKINLEDAARRARYGFFAKLVEQGVVDAVATAHTMDDQAETVLAHILRGTGIAGLAGIHPTTGDVVRPLLNFRRDDLRKYLRAKRQTWREDASNRDTVRTRARMRKILMPLLEKRFNPAVVAHLAGLAERALEQNAFVECLVGQVFHNTVAIDGKRARIGRTQLLRPLEMTHSAACRVLQAKLIQYTAARVRKHAGQIAAGHIDQVLRLAEQGEPGKRLQLPGGVDVLREREALLFFQREK